MVRPNPSELSVTIKFLPVAQYHLPPRGLPFLIYHGGRLVKNGSDLFRGVCLAK